MVWNKDDIMKNNLPTPITGYLWRPARREDALDLYHLYQAHDQADHTHYAESLETVYNDFDTPRVNVEDDTMVAISDEGELVATGWILINNIAEAQRRAFLWGCVHPQHRRRGLGSMLFRWQVETGTRRLDAFDDEVEHALRCFSSQHITDRIHLYQREGFDEVRRSYYMDRDLSQPISLASVRENVQIIHWDATRNAEALKVCNTAFRDHWGFEPISTADWNLEYVGNADFCPKSSRMAICDGKIVGIALVHIPMNQSADKRRGWIWELGVLRDYRKQGIASALLTGVMQTLREDGLDAASLSVDTQNLTGALRLYESLGFYADQVSISYARVVKTPAAVCVG
jgi:ribosomal protein S18 acetylase RimI-like enzyme